MDLFRKKEIADLNESTKSLHRCLSAFDLTLMGVGAIIGAGVFVLTGLVAATQAGPAIIFSYLIAGLACAFSALSYAELASSIGGCGSAYGYAYVGFGEIIAWIVGWDLLLEYSITVSTVSVGWSGYFNDLLLALKIHIPTSLLTAPQNGGIMNVLAFGIIIILACLLMLGIKSTTRINNIMVAVKLFVIGLFIAVAFTEFDLKNWTPFLPYGWGGVMSGASLIFFAYVGFDAVSTAAEETINPQRALPLGILGALTICTFVYITVSGLLTGIVPYATLNVTSPISHSLLTLGHKAVASLIGVGAVAGLTTVILVLFYGLTRIFFAMARDGLLPSFFAVTHDKTKSPIRIIIFCATLMAPIAGLIAIDDLAEIVNIGTLFAFMIVCGGVIVLRYTRPDLPRAFKTPLMPLIPALGILSCGYLIAHLPTITMIRFGMWMTVGMVIYFIFSRKNSVLSSAR